MATALISHIPNRSRLRNVDSEENFRAYLRHGSAAINATDAKRKKRPINSCPIRPLAVAVKAQLAAQCEVQRRIRRRPELGRGLIGGCLPKLPQERLLGKGT